MADKTYVELNFFNSKPSINACLEEDHLLWIFFKLGGHCVGRVASVCQLWAKLVKENVLWEEECCNLWAWGSTSMFFSNLALNNPYEVPISESPEFASTRAVILPRKVKSLKKKVDSKFSKSWQRMFIERPHVRLDGAYYLKTTYWQTGGLGLTHTQRVHEISYYRILQFQTNGVVYYALSNDPPLLGQPLKKNVFRGIYRPYTNGVVVRVDVKYQVSNLKLLYSQTRKGAHDRLIFTDFVGQSESDPIPVRFPVPDSLFQFHPFGENNPDIISPSQRAITRPSTSYSVGGADPKREKKSRRLSSGTPALSQIGDFKLVDLAPVDGIVPTGVRSSKATKNQSQENKKEGKELSVTKITKTVVPTAPSLPKTEAKSRGMLDKNKPTSALSSNFKEKKEKKEEPPAVNIKEKKKKEDDVLPPNPPRSSLKLSNKKQKETKEVDKKTGMPKKNERPVSGPKKTKAKSHQPNK